MKENAAIVYARQSSGKEEESESIEMQKMHCEELAQAMGLRIVGSYVDSNSSGRLYPNGAEHLAMLDSAFQDWYRTQTCSKMFRSGFAQVIGNLPFIKYLIVDDLTRIARPVSGSYLQNFIQQQLRIHHVQILTVKDGAIDYNDFCDRLVSDIQSSITDNQIRIQSQKAKDALRKIKDDGIYPNLPKMFGILPGLARKTIVVDAERARVIKYVYAAFLGGESLSAIQWNVNQRWAHLFPGRCCYVSTLRNIIRTPFYCGFMRNSKGILIPAKQIAGQEIIDLADWQRAQDLMASKNALRTSLNLQTRHAHPFSGLLKCGRCGANLIFAKDKGRECYYCHIGSHILKRAECADARINLTMVRKTSPYFGLQQAIFPLLLLAPQGLEYKKEILCKTLDASEFYRLLHQAIREIMVFRDFLNIKTAVGLLKLPRYIDGKYRNLPKYSIRLTKGDSVLEITYIYKQNGRRELIMETPPQDDTDKIISIKIFFKA